MLRIDDTRAFIVETDPNPALTAVSLVDGSTTTLTKDALLSFDFGMDDAFLYFARIVGTETAITRVAKDGSASEDIATAGPIPTTLLFGPVAVNGSWVYAFQAEGSQVSIVRAPKSGGAIDRLVALGSVDLAEPLSIACSLVADDTKVYWSSVPVQAPPNYDRTTVVGRMNVDGTQAEIVQAHAVDVEPHCTTVTMDDASVYWWEFDVGAMNAGTSALIEVDKATDKIGWRAAEDGILTSNPIRSDGTHLYWTTGLSIHSVTRTGEKPTTFAVAATNTAITDLAVRGGNVYWLEATPADSRGAFTTELKTAPVR